MTTLVIIVWLLVLTIWLSVLTHGDLRREDRIIRLEEDKEIPYDR